MKFKYIATFAIFLFSNTAHSYDCIGPVSYVTIMPATGSVLATVISGSSVVIKNNNFCSVQSEANGIGPETCRVIYSTLLVAQTTGKRVRLRFNDAGGSCTSHPEWGVLNGLYLGPELLID